MSEAKYVICDKCHKGVSRDDCDVVCGRIYNGTVYRYYCKDCMGKILTYNQRRLEWEKEHALNTIR